jgi:hypothetical protein
MIKATLKSPHATATHSMNDVPTIPKKNSNISANTLFERDFVTGSDHAHITVASKNWHDQNKLHRPTKFDQR